MSNTNHIPDEKIQQAFDLFLSLQRLNLELPKEKRELNYKFGTDDYCVEFWVFPYRGIGVVKFIQVWRFDTESKIDDLIDMIEEELAAQRSHRKEQAHSGD